MNVNPKEKKRYRKAIAFDSIILWLSVWLITSVWWIRRSFGGVTISRIVYHVTTTLRGVEPTLVSSLFGSYLRWIIVVPGVCTALYLIARYLLEKKVSSKKQIMAKRVFRIMSLLLCVASIVFSAVWLRFPAYLYSMLQPSAFIEEHYVDPANTEIRFPNEKRNLIYIFLESIENTYAGIEVGGIEPVSLIPNLTDIALDTDTVMFSNNKPGMLGGFDSVQGTDWTAAAMVSHTSGIPLLVTLRSALFLGADDFLPGVVSIGDVLRQEGYQQTLLVGSDAVFGQRESLFRTHGGYKIFDVKYAFATGRITETSGSWGFTDDILYEFAKQEVTRLAQNAEPFNLTLLTVDTHFPDGDIYGSHETRFELQYQNVIYNSDRQIAEFLDWASTQPWYEDTTMVIVGDHETMDPLYTATIPDNYHRTMYNAIINSQIPASEVGASRLYLRTYTSLDLFPTTLAAMGATIAGDRLALGTNLFSDRPTLAEQFGLDTLDEEFSRHSAFYSRELMR